MGAHFQCAIWLQAMEADPPVLEPTEYGWTKEEDMLLPTTLPEGVDPLPKEVMKIIACNCQPDEPCSQGSCTCKKNKMPCSIFCKCRVIECFSSLTVEKNANAANDNDDDDDDKDEELPDIGCLLYTSPSPRDRTRSRMPSSA